MYEFVNDKQLSAFAKACVLVFAVTVGGAVITQSKAENAKIKETQKKIETTDIGNVGSVIVNKNTTKQPKLKP